jgi:hypothetical protein
VAASRRDLRYPRLHLSTTAIDMPTARQHVVGIDTVGRGIDVDAATLTTTSRPEWSEPFTNSVDTVASPER